MVYSILLLMPLVGLCWGVEICCPGAGCFNDNPPFDHLPLPQCAETIQVSMRNFRRSNPTQGQALTRTTVSPNYDGALRTVFIVHGFFGSKDDDWLVWIKDAFFNRGFDYNVVLVGWSGGSEEIWYPFSASNTRVVGKEISLIAENLIARGDGAAARMYCVGHSLGSHICGHFGKGLPGLGRITALDPAGPAFDDVDMAAGVNPGDATLVDVIHTHGKGVLPLGTMQPRGHVDFYPNGGGHQPCCVIDPFNPDPMCDSGIDLTPVCSHLRVLDLYQESLQNDQCRFISRNKCTDYNNMPASCYQTCGEEVCSVMGWETEDFSERGLFYLETGGGPIGTYCLG